MKGLFLHVEDEVGVEVLAIDASLKVEVFGGGASRTSKQGDGLSGFDGISAVYQVFGVMAIDGFQPEGVAHDYHVAVCAVVLGHAYHSVESAPYGVFGVGLDVDAAVSSPSPSVWRDDFSAGQGEGVFAIQYGFQGEFYFVSLREQSGVVTRTWLISMAEKLFFFSCAVASRGSSSRQQARIWFLMGWSYSKYCMVPPVAEAYFSNRCSIISAASASPS